jgi:arsenite methyltransferase
MPNEVAMMSEGEESARQRAAVRERYARIARGERTPVDESGVSEETESTEEESTEDASTSATGGGCSSAGGCCESASVSDDRDAYDRALGYSDSELDAVAEGANLHLGCGNPTALASLETGETVLDLGSGAGFDCFLAAQEVGPTGRVVGVDMTPEMVEKARENVRKNEATNVEFRLGEIEHLPVADDSMSVVISNCVVNLSPDKAQVFREALRVLRPGGRLAISDVVLTAEPPEPLAPDPDSVAACVGGASSIGALESMLRDAGFEDVSIRPKDDSEFIREWSDDRDLTDYLVSATIEGRKPDSTAQA